jgi:hypothetical protein
MKVSRSTKLTAVGIALGLVAAMPLNAATIDLTAGGSQTVNGAFFTTTDVGSTGTGVISSFVRVQDNGIADGYNSSVRPVMPDVNTSPTFTHELQLIDVPVVVNPTGAVAGSYYEFLLDINQTKESSLLSLDKIQIYTSAAALLTANTLTALTDNASLVYDLAANTILLNYQLNNGSGSGDLFVYVPVDLFGATSDYVYLYSMFGATGGEYAENDGFEEWAVRKTSNPPSVPDSGATVMVLGGALVALGLVRRRIA